MYNALQDSTIAGAIASSTLSTLFALAFLASGQNSTITGTLTGQIVMEGFLHLKLPQRIIRIGTRIFSLLPVIIVGHQERTLDQLLVYSQFFFQSLFHSQYQASFRYFLNLFKLGLSISLKINKVIIVVVGL